MLTDTANFRNPNYHKKTDTIDTIDFEFMSRIIRSVGACAIHWAGLPSAARGIESASP